MTSQLIITLVNQQPYESDTNSYQVSGLIGHLVSLYKDSLVINTLNNTVCYKNRDNYYCKLKILTAFLVVTSTTSGTLTP